MGCFNGSDFGEAGGRRAGERCRGIGNGEGEGEG